MESNLTPWEEARLASSSHSDLFQERNKAKTKEEQDKLAPYEHRAFAREAVEEKPWLAIPIALATPLYQASKAVGLENSRSAPSAKQVTEGYKGIGEGLAATVKKPWEEAKEEATKIIKKVGSILPWEEAAKPIPRMLAKPQFADRFEEVFSKLINQESGGKHEVGGKLLTSPKGAAGITQLMPHTSADPGYGIKPLQNKSQAEYVRLGRDYLKAMLTEFNGDYEKALAAYNAGPGNVKEAISKGGPKWKDFLPKKSETLPYINNILGKKKNAS